MVKNPLLCLQCSSLLTLIFLSPLVLALIRVQAYGAPGATATALQQRLSLQFSHHHWRYMVDCIEGTPRSFNRRTRQTTLFYDLLKSRKDVGSWGRPTDMKCKKELHGLYGLQISPKFRKSLWCVSRTRFFCCAARKMEMGDRWGPHQHLPRLTDSIYRHSPGF